MKNMENKDYINIAHAGYENQKPNSLASVVGIKQVCCDALEVDVRKEGEILYLSHDFCGNSANCLKLEDVFQWIKDNDLLIKIGIDLKEPVYEDVQKLSEKYDLNGSLIYSGCFFLKDLQKNRGKNKVYYNLENSISCHMNDLMEERKMSEFIYLFELLKQTGADGINLYYRWYSGEIKELLDETGLEAAVWTVDTIEDMKIMIERGAKCITTNAPGVLAGLKKGGYL